MRTYTMTGFMVESQSNGNEHFQVAILGDRIIQLSRKTVLFIGDDEPVGIVALDDMVHEFCKESAKLQDLDEMSYQYLTPKMLSKKKQENGIQIYIRWVTLYIQGTYPHQGVESHSRETGNHVRRVAVGSPAKTNA